MEALTTALQLDREGTEHALRLARSRPSADRSSTTRAKEKVPVGVRMLLESISVPAFVMSRYRDVLAANALATRLEPSLARGGNRLLSLFTDPDARSDHPNWNENTASVVAQLRADIGADADDPRFQAIVGELALKSERFRRLWARHDVAATGSPVGTILHPQVGELILHREKFALAGADRLVLVAYHAEPGSVSAERLSRLQSTPAT